MSEFKFSCPNCGQHLRTDMDSVGVQYRCPACGVDFVVPNPKSATSLRLEDQLYIPPPHDAHSAPVSAAASRATIPLPRPTRPAAPPAPSMLNPLSILTVVFALIPFIGGPPAIICGHRALREIANDPRLGGRNLAMLGLAIGYLSVAITLGLLAARILHRS